jgi:hypothetical protein
MINRNNVDDIPVSEPSIGSLKDAFARETAAPRILIFDIERSPAHARVFSQKVRFSPVSTWVKLPQTICMASQWVGQKKVMFHAAWESDDPHYLAKQTWELFDQATHAVGFNSKNFDEKHLRSLWVEAGLVPPRKWVSVDLYLVNRQFGFESKSLRHLCERLGVQNKEGHYDAAQAEAAMAGDVKAQKALKAYNQADVRATAACLQRLTPWLGTQSMSLNLYYGTDETPRCINCGAEHTLEPAGWASTKLTRYAAYRCSPERGGCGTLMRSNHRKHNVNLRGV